MEKPLPEHPLSPLPPLYAAWMEQVLAGPIPAETEATCNHCAMCSHTSDQPTSGTTLFFNPQVKCCTYLPTLHNFLVGRVLMDDDPALTQGQASVKARITKGVAVTPLGLGKNPIYSLLYGQSPEAFGKSSTMRCPHYIEDGGLCGVWRHRESTCVTWFCKHVRGTVSMKFWHALQQLLAGVEKNLAQWCVQELDVGVDALRLLFPTPQDEASHSLQSHQLDGTIDPKHYKAIWGNWIGREEEFFIASASLVNALNWQEISAICGPEIEIYTRLTRQAYQALLSDALPPRLQLHSFKTISMSPQASYVWAYSPLDPLKLPRPLLEVLPYFNGCSPAEAQRLIESEKNLKVSTSLIRKLVDFGILAASDDSVE